MLQLWDVDYDEWQASQLFTQTYTNQITSWLVRNWNTFGVETNHEHTRTHKTHHGPDLGEATTFPLIVFFVISHGGYIQMSFCLGTFKLEVSKFFKFGLSWLWRPILFFSNLRLRWGLSKVVAFVKNFPVICGTPPSHKQIRAIFDF
jgi:hypothetical protein